MKRVVLVVASARSADATGFIREYERLGGRLDGILILSRLAGLARPLREVIRLGRSAGPVSLRNAATEWLARWLGMQTLSCLKTTWGNRGGLDEGDSVDLVRYAAAHDIPVFMTRGWSLSVLDRLCAEGPVLFPVYAGGKLTREVLGVSGAEFINAHMGEMPRYRGMNVIEWAVLEGSAPQVAVMVMNERIDGGDVLMHRPIQVDGATTVLELRRAGFRACFRAMAEGVYRYAQGDLQRHEQPRGARYYYRMHPRIRERLCKVLSGR